MESDKLVSTPGSNTSNGETVDYGLPCGLPEDIRELFSETFTAGWDATHAPEDISARKGTKKKKLMGRESASNYRQKKKAETVELKRRCKAAEDTNDLLQQVLRRCLATIRRLEEMTSKQT
jgi:hypothetical protein